MIVFIWRTWQIFSFSFWEVGDIPKKLAQGERFRSDEHTHKKTDNCFCAVTFVYNTSVTAPQQTPGAVLSELQKNADDFIQPRAKLCAFDCQVDDNRKTASRSLERGNQIADLHVLFAQKKKPKNLNRKKSPVSCVKDLSMKRVLPEHFCLPVLLTSLHT